MVLGRQPFNLLLMLIARKKPGSLYRPSLVTDIAQAVLLQLRNGKRRVIKRVHADTPGPCGYQHKWLLKTGQVRYHGGGTVMEPDTGHHLSNCQYYIAPPYGRQL